VDDPLNIAVSWENAMPLHNPRHINRLVIPFKVRTFTKYSSLIMLIILFAMMVDRPWSANAAAFVVDRTDDDPTAKACTGAPNDCSLRGAILAANENGGASDTITLPAGTYTLTQVGSGDEAGDLNINTSLSIVGDGASVTTIDGNGSVIGERVLVIYGGHVVEISGVTITDGANTGIVAFGELDLTSCVISSNLSTGSGGGIYTSTGLTLDDTSVINNTSDNVGGGIYVFGGDVTISSSTISGNATVGSKYGGGIYQWSTGTVRIEDSTISSNEAYGGGGISSAQGTLELSQVTMSGNTARTGDGGAIYKSGTGTMDIEDSTISGNTAAGGGGGVYAVISSTTIDGSTISGNAANGTGDGGGGIFHAAGTLTMINSSISGNSTKNHGGGMYVYSDNDGIMLTNVTITDNAADSDTLNGGTGGGVHNSYGTLTLVNTIIADNAGDQCVAIGSGAFNSLGLNLSSDATCNLIGPGDQPSTAPLLGALMDNGGYTYTHALSINSPAIDAGTLVYCPGVDQRDWPRAMRAGCDIGAFEAPWWVFLPITMK
jgi:predicted outer membrane repeat protein